MQKVLEYEQTAAECREMAAKMQNPRHKKQLEDMAEMWEMLARERRQGIVENEPNSALRFPQQLRKLRHLDRDAKRQLHVIMVPVSSRVSGLAADRGSSK
jgi:hypothetical protein